MLCMNDQLTAFATAMASTNPDFASLLAQQQLISAAAGSLTTQTTPAIQTHPTSSNSTSPLQNQGGALSANGMKQMTPTQGANSSAPPSQKPSFSLAPISEVEMMKYFNNSAQLLPQPALTQPQQQQQQQQNQAGAQPAAPQPQKMQTQFLLASAQIDDKKPKMEGQTTTPNVVHHPSPLNPTSVAAQMGQTNLAATNPVASTLHHPAPLHPSPLSAQQQVAQLTSPVNAAVLALQQQQNANPQLKRTQPMAVPGQQQQQQQQQQAQQTAQTTGTIPFNIMQSYQEQLLASMNGPPPAKRHSISAVPLQQQQQTPGSQASVAASLAHPLATLPILQSALNPQFAAAATQASLHAQQHLNALGKAGQASSILQLPTIPPAFVATAQARQNGQEQGMNGLTAAGLNPNNQLLGLPEGLNLQQLQQLFLQQQRNQLIAAQQNAAQAQLRLNGQQNQQLQMPLGTAAATAQALQQAQQQQQNQQAQQQAQQTAQNAAVASAAAAAAQNPAMALYHQQFLQMMQQQQKAALAAANGIQVGANAQNQLGAQNAAAQALQAQQQQLQQFLLQQQQANAALVAEQQRRRATIGNPNQLNAVMAAAAANQQQQQQQQQQAQPPQMQQMPALGSQLAALMAAAQRNSPAQQAANAAAAVAAANRQNETAPGSTAATVGSNNSPAVVTLDDQGNQPPKLQRVSPTNGGDDVQKLLAQINASNNANNNASMDANAQQQAILQQFQQQQQQLTQNRLLQIQQQFADAQSSQAQMNANPVLSFASPHNPLAVSSSSGQLPQSTMASLAASMAQQGQGILSQASMAGLSQANMGSLSQGISQTESILSQGQGFLSQGVNTTLQQQQQQLPTPIPISGQQLQIPGQPQMAQNPPISSAASSANGVQSNGLAPEGSPLTVPKASPAAAGNPSTPMTAVSRESASTEPCLVIADDDEQNPVVD